MRLCSLSLLLALGVAGIGGCSGSGTVSSTRPSPDSTYDTPPPGIDPVQTQDQTPTAYDTPPTDYQPGDGSTTSQGPGPVCPRLCKVAVELQCLSDQQGGDARPITDEECEAGCEQGLGQLTMDVPCLSEMVDLFTCVYDHSDGLTCDLFNRAQGGNLNQNQADELNQLVQQASSSCGKEITDYQGCEELHPTMPADMPPQGRCQMPSCMRCQDDCERCLCDADPTACMNCPM